MRVNHKALGVIFLCLLLAGVWLTYGIFSKKFVDYDKVTLQTSTLGLQLPERADVKIRGVIVGEVLGFDTDEEGAKVTLGLYPDQVRTIPANVTGSIVPKTLFGEKYVSLEVPQDPSPDHIEAGATIDADPGRDRGREGPQRPLPAAARRPAGRDQPDPQRDRHRPRGSRRADRREPRDGRRLPQAAQPADPRDRRRPPADGEGVHDLRRRDARDRPDPASTPSRPRPRSRVARRSSTPSSTTCPASPTTPVSSCATTATTSSGSASSARPSCACWPSTRRSTPA